MKKTILAIILAASMIVTAYATSGYGVGPRDGGEKKNKTTVTSNKDDKTEDKTEDKADDPGAESKGNPDTGR